jgi:hypothetical protein
MGSRRSAQDPVQRRSSWPRTISRSTNAFFGAFGAAWDDAMVARWSANPLGMLRPGVDAMV